MSTYNQYPRHSIWAVAVLAACADSTHSDAHVRKEYSLGLQRVSSDSAVGWCLAVKSSAQLEQPQPVGAELVACNIVSGEEFLNRWDVQELGVGVFRITLIDGGAGAATWCLGTDLPMPDPGSAGKIATVMRCMGSEGALLDWEKIELGTQYVQFRLHSSSMWCLGSHAGGPPAGESQTSGDVVACADGGIDGGPGSQNWLLIDGAL